jgi:DNA recombination protein RmuC
MLEHASIWLSLCIALTVLFLAALGSLLWLASHHRRLRADWQRAVQSEAVAIARLHELEQRQAQSQADTAQSEMRWQLAAQTLLEKSSQSLLNQGEARWNLLLTPFQQRLKELQQRLEAQHQQETVQREVLKHEIERLAKTGLALSEEAHRLANALGTQSKAQGTLGEVILESLLMHAGLQEGREYALQVRAQDREGRILQPDVVVHLPGERDLIIDAKVSLTAFERWRADTDGAEAETHLKAHAASVRKHIQTLAEKRYQDAQGVQTLDFVVLFMPLEGAYQAALLADAGLHQWAWERHLVILPPSGLIATLRMVSSLWQGELRARHARELSQLASGLQDKIMAFAEDWNRCERAVSAAGEALASAKKRLWTGRGNAASILKKMSVSGAGGGKVWPTGWKLEDAGEDQVDPGAQSTLPERPANPS